MRAVRAVRPELSVWPFCREGAVRAAGKAGRLVYGPNVIVAPFVCIVLLRHLAVFSSVSFVCICIGMVLSFGVCLGRVVRFAVASVPHLPSVCLTVHAPEVSDRSLCIFSDFLHFLFLRLLPAVVPFACSFVSSVVPFAEGLGGGRRQMLPVVAFVHAVRLVRFRNFAVPRLRRDMYLPVRRRPNGCGRCFYALRTGRTFRPEVGNRRFFRSMLAYCVRIC